MKKTIAIVGGIGSGKSVVSHILRLLGYDVYDCDSNAKLLMNTSTRIQSQLIDAFGSEVVSSNGEINRRRLRDIIFRDKTSLNTINGIVHPAVKEDINQRMSESKSKLYFVETALPQESGIDKKCDYIWLVDASKDIRISRVMARNSFSREQVEERMSKQDYSKLDDSKTIKITNDNLIALLPQVVNALNEIQK